MSVNFDYFIAACVALNTICLMCDFHDAPKWYSDTLNSLNMVFVIIYSLEAMVKLLGEGFKMYFSIRQNIFDFTLVVISIIGSF